jgi:hypothetical protein
MALPDDELALGILRGSPPLEEVVLFIGVFIDTERDVTPDLEEGLSVAAPLGTGLALLLIDAARGTGEDVHRDPDMRDFGALGGFFSVSASFLISTTGSPMRV